MPHSTTPAGPHQDQPIRQAGLTLSAARAAMILIHGRGDTASGILQLAAELHHPSFAYLAPQARHNTWYPYSFLAPIAQNEPGISSGLAQIAYLVAEIIAGGIPAERIIIAGFSQGACLSSEFIARQPQRYGGLLVFSGGLIGPPETPRDYPGDLAGTPVFVGCSDVDFHIPVKRVRETTATLTRMGAVVNEKIYPGMGHTINADELAQAMKIINAVGAGER